ncbi:MAG TPA: carotenoid oxygenase family protein, partial [Stellaceae bacterium]|nr:carotenoid oxygenase family protein [Stellaceae bacterium]
TSDPSVMGRESGGPANGNVVWHGGRLLALSSNNLPVEIDWQRLDTVGSWNFGGSQYPERALIPRSIQPPKSFTSSPMAPTDR